MFSLRFRLRIAVSDVRSQVRDGDFPHGPHFETRLFQVLFVGRVQTDGLSVLAFRYFRVIPANEFLKEFASDRRHMKRPDGTWIKPPPNYPAIQTASK
jgi:hypothetical protein